MMKRGLVIPPLNITESPEVPRESEIRVNSGSRDLEEHRISQVPTQRPPAPLLNNQELPELATARSSIRTAYLSLERNLTEAAFDSGKIFAWQRLSEHERMVKILTLESGLPTEDFWQSQSLPARFEIASKAAAQEKLPLVELTLSIEQVGLEKWLKEVESLTGSSGLFSCFSEMLVRFVWEKNQPLQRVQKYQLIERGMNSEEKILEGVNWYMFVNKIGQAIASDARDKYVNRPDRQALQAERIPLPPGLKFCLQGILSAADKMKIWEKLFPPEHLCLEFQQQGGQLTGYRLALDQPKHPVMPFEKDWEGFLMQLPKLDFSRMVKWLEYYEKKLYYDQRRQEAKDLLGVSLPPLQSLQPCSDVEEEKLRQEIKQMVKKNQFTG